MSIEKILVASVISIGRIVINKGSNDGITHDMEFVVYTNGKEIFDPTTKKSLGILENAKGTFKVMHLQGNMSTLVTTKKLPSPLIRTSMIFGTMEEELRLLESIREGDFVKIINQR